MIKEIIIFYFKNSIKHNSMVLIDIHLKVTYNYINRININVMDLYLYSFIDEKDDHKNEIIYKNNEYTKYIYKQLYEEIINENFSSLFNLITIERI